MATCNIQSLLNNAACFNCLPEGMQDIIELQLLCEIFSAGAGGGGGGGSVQVISTTDTNPNTAAITPSNVNIGAFWYQDPATGTGTNFWTWSVTNQNWSQFSA